MARWILLGACAVALIAHALCFDFVTDDAFISFVFSRNFAEHGQLAFNLGQPVEGYTNFLWTLILGIGMWIGAAPELLSRVLSAMCAVATLYLTVRIAERALGRRTPLAVVPAGLLAASSGFACWTSGGLETQLYTVLVIAALDAVVTALDHPRALRRAGVWLALAAMTRPEGPMVAAIFGVAWLIARLVATRGSGRGVREEVLAIAAFLALWAPWFAWRWWYYGWPFPNTYYVKATGAWAHPDMPGQMRGNGLYYVWVWLRQTRLVYGLPVVVIGLVTAPRRSPRFVLAIACALFAAIYLAYTVSVGGDFMGLHRFIMPVFVVAALAVTLGVDWLGARLPRVPALVIGGAAVLGFVISQIALTRDALAPTNLTADHGIDTPAFLIRYTADRAAIGRAMAPCFAPDDFSIVGGAGAQPYYGRMRAIDAFGLVSETIAHDEPRIRPRAGHTKFGSDHTLAAYDPTFVFSCYAIHARPEAPSLPCAGSWLQRGFAPVTMQIPEMQEGAYYTFLAKRARNFQCPGVVAQ